MIFFNHESKFKGLFFVFVFFFFLFCLGGGGGME